MTTSARLSSSYDRILSGPGLDRCLGASQNDGFYARHGFRNIAGGGLDTDRARIFRSRPRAARRTTLLTDVLSYGVVTAQTEK